MRYTWLYVFIFIVGLILWIGRPCPKAPANTEEFKDFILIEYDRGDKTFTMVTDLIDKSKCLQEVLQNECLLDSILINDYNRRVESVQIRLSSQ